VPASEHHRAESYGDHRNERASRGNPLQVSLFCLIGMSVIGFLVGVRTPHLATLPGADAAPNHSGRTHPEEHGVVAALWYHEIEGNLSPNTGFASELSELADPSEMNNNPQGDSTLYPFERRVAAIALRKKRRAYFGAPPVVPHPVDQLSVASCLSCHEHGLRIGDRVAAAIPHQAYESCTQCHVEQNDLREEEIVWLRNSFVGQAEAAQGTRAYVGAPPTIPHDISMRSVCLSCHGPTGRHGLRSNHPTRRSCLQCHALDDALNRRRGK